MKRSLSSLIENTDVREFKVVDIEVEKISESKTQARTYFDEKTRCVSNDRSRRDDENPY